MLDLVPLFGSLQIPVGTPADDVRFSASVIPGFRHRIAKDANGAPALLISCRPSSVEFRSAPVVLEHLTVLREVDCRVLTSDGRIDQDRFTVIHCTNADAMLQEQFLRVAGSAVLSLGQNPSDINVARVIETLTELFRSMDGAGRKQVQGLWAELFLMARSVTPAVLVSAWHLTKDDTYDFNAGAQRVEVKSTLSTRRQHHFSFDQIYPPVGTELLIASVMMKRSGGGVSLAELANRVRASVSSSPDVLLRLEAMIGITLGANWRQDMQERFDDESAETSLQFYRPQDIPRPAPNLPSGVSNLHFTADLTGATSIHIGRARSVETLFDALRSRKT